MRQKRTTSKKTWLKARLYELGKSSEGLARYLKVPGPRIYEVIGGRRRLQPTEFGPTAKFLDWSLATLLDKLPPDERVMNVDGKLPQASRAAKTKSMSERVTDLERRIAELEWKVG